MQELNVKDFYDKQARIAKTRQSIAACREALVFEETNAKPRQERMTYFLDEIDRLERELRLLQA